MTIVPFQPAAQAGQRPTWIDVMDRGVELAEIIASTDFVPKAFRNNQPAILAAILYGHELGLEPMQSLNSISVIEGKPTMSAEAQRGLILAAGHELWFDELTNTRVTIKGRRRDSKQIHSATWTIDDAKRARLAGKANWQAYPRQMLVARATAELARDVFADVTRGFGTTEELSEDVAAAEGQPEPQEVKKTTRRSRATATHSEDPPPPDPPADPPPPPPSPGPPPVAPKPDPPAAPDADPEPNPPSEQQAKMMFALFNEAGMADRDERLAFSEKVLERTLGSSRELSALDVHAIIDALNAEIALGETKEPMPEGEQSVLDELERELDARPALPDDPA